MREVFEVELSSRSRRGVQLILPAQPYDMLDAVEQLRLEEGETIKWVLPRDGCFGYDEVFQVLDRSGSLYELNALAQRLSVLGDGQQAVLDGLLKLEPENRHGCAIIPIPRLIDLAYSTDCCHMVEGITTDAQLGRFCAESGFVPGADDLSDKMFALLDFARIGREFREAEGGVFTAQGYVQRHDDLRQVYETLDLTLQIPDYTILAETASGCEVKLPVPMGGPTGNEPAQCLDCAAPALTGLTATLGTLDMLARRLAELKVDGELLKYRAVLEATGCDDICRALILADELDQYMLDFNCYTPKEVGMSALHFIVPQREIAALLPHVDLEQYGQALIQAGGGMLTGYGLIERVGHEPIRSMGQEPTRGGMEMM